MKRLQPMSLITDVDIEALYRSDLTRVVRLAFLLLGDASLAEEIGQEAFARLLQQGRTPREPAAYLTTITVNLCRDHGRRSTTARLHPPPPSHVEPAPQVPREVDEVWQAVQRLPRVHRDAVVLRYWADLSTAEVARILDIRPGTARSALHRALKSLKETLHEE